jgi:glutamate N-acetyltransferase/amino-acid N-acetyltransferase
VLIDEGASGGRGVHPQNRFCAAPVQVCREHLAAGQGIRAMVINTGNANAGTGDEGLARARSTCIAAGASPEHFTPANAAVFHRRHHGAAAGRPH